jgi:hypothetical protein
LAAAALAGLLAWGAAGALTPFFPIPPPLQIPNDRIHTGRLFAQFVAATRDASLTWAITGGLLGLALGLAGAAAAAPRRALPAALAGAIVGAVLGAGPILVVFPVYWNYKSLHNIEDLLWLSLATHAVAWAPAGLAGGLALGLGLGGRGRAARAALGGLVGATLGVAAYDLIGGLVLPFDALANEAVPGAAYARLIATLLVAVGAAAGATWEAVGRRTRSTAPIHHTP